MGLLSCLSDTTDGNPLPSFLYKTVLLLLGQVSFQQVPSLQGMDSRPHASSPSLNVMMKPSCLLFWRQGLNSLALRFGGIAAIQPSVHHRPMLETRVSLLFAL